MRMRKIGILIALLAMGSFAVPVCIHRGSRNNEGGATGAEFPPEQPERSKSK